MLWTLWRAILVEMWRLLLLATAVLVTVVAFAATVKPLADGKLTADQAIRFMVYAIPPMLAYALPFAAGFAATLAYHRFATDNEVTAAQAGGVSHRRLLVPAALTGLVLAGGLWAMNDRVIPVFLRRMEEMITRDFARIMVASLRQGESATIGDTEIHADHVEQVAPEAGSPVLQQFLLAGVAMVETDGSGAIQIDGTAKRAWILLLPVWALGAEDRARIGDDDATAVVMKFIDVTIYRDGAPQSADPLVAPAIPIPSVFEDDPKYASGAELRRIARDPDSMSFVDRRRVALARSEAAGDCYTRFARALSQGAAVELRAGDGTTVRVLGAALRADGTDWVIEPVRETGAVEVEVVGAGGRTDRLRARAARLAMQTPAEDDPLANRAQAGGSRFELSLSGVRVLGSGGAAGTELASTTYRDLFPQDDPLPALLAMSSEELLGREGVQRQGAVDDAAQRLKKEIRSLRREVLSKSHERVVMSVTCMVMVVLGAVMAMRLRDATPLVVYLWSFFPALFAVIVQEAGQEAVHNGGAGMLPVQYAGAIALAVISLLAYRSLARR